MFPFPFIPENLLNTFKIETVLYAVRKVVLDGKTVYLQITGDRILSVSRNGRNIAHFIWPFSHI